MAKLSQVPVQLQLLPQLALVQVQVDQQRVEQGRKESVETTLSPMSSTNLSQVSGYASDNLDEPDGGDNAGDAMDVDGEDGEDDEKPVPAKKRKLTKAAEAKLKAKEKKKKGSDDEDEDAYTALSKSLWSTGTSKPPVGSFEKCAVCKKQFTVVCYKTFSQPSRTLLMKPV